MIGTMPKATAAHSRGIHRTQSRAFRPLRGSAIESVARRRMEAVGLCDRAPPARPLHDERLVQPPDPTLVATMPKVTEARTRGLHRSLGRSIRAPRGPAIESVARQRVEAMGCMPSATTAFPATLPMSRLTSSHAYDCLFSPALPAPPTSHAAPDRPQRTG